MVIENAERCAAWDGGLRVKADFDPRSNEWLAFHKADGRPYLAYAPTLSEALSLCFLMILEDKNAQAISQKSS